MEGKEASAWVVFGAAEGVWTLWGAEAAPGVCQTPAARGADPASAAVASPGSSWTPRSGRTAPIPPERFWTAGGSGAQPAALESVASWVLWDLKKETMSASVVRQHGLMQTDAKIPPQCCRMMSYREDAKRLLV